MQIHPSNLLQLAPPTDLPSFHLLRSLPTSFNRPLRSLQSSQSQALPLHLASWFHGCFLAFPWVRTIIHVEPNDFRTLTLPPSCSSSSLPIFPLASHSGVVIFALLNKLLFLTIPRFFYPRAPQVFDWDEPEKWKKEKIVNDPQYYAQNAGLELEETIVESEDGFYLK